MATIGLKDVYYAVITQDDETGTTYDTPKKFSPAMTLTKTPSYNRSNLRGDDRVVATAGSKGPMSVSVGLTDLTKEAKIDVLGMKVSDTGGIIYGSNDQPKDVALLYKAKKTNGKYRYDVIYKVQFNPVEESLQTEQETPTFSTPTLNGEAIPRMFDGEEGQQWDEDDADVTTAFLDTFFDAVPEPTVTPEV